MILNFITPYVSMPSSTKFGIKMSNFKVRVINKRKCVSFKVLQNNSINSVSNLKKDLQISKKIFL